MACSSDQTALERSITAVLDGEVSYELDDDTLVVRAESTDDGIGLTFAAN
jgi:heat shock protein HslJ